jgi:hypothetical protein
MVTRKYLQFHHVNRRRYSNRLEGEKKKRWVVDLWMVVLWTITMVESVNNYFLGNTVVTVQASWIDPDTPQQYHTTQPLTAGDLRDFRLVCRGVLL